MSAVCRDLWLIHHSRRVRPHFFQCNFLSDENGLMHRWGKDLSVSAMFYLISVIWRLFQEAHLTIMETYSPRSPAPPALLYVLNCMSALLFDLWLIAQYGHVRPHRFHIFHCNFLSAQGNFRLRAPKRPQELQELPEKAEILWLNLSSRRFFPFVHWLNLSARAWAKKLEMENIYVHMLHGDT